MKACRVRSYSLVTASCYLAGPVWCKRRASCEGASVAPNQGNEGDTDKFAAVRTA